MLSWTRILVTALPVALVIAAVPAGTASPDPNAVADAVFARLLADLEPGDGGDGGLDSHLSGKKIFVDPGHGGSDSGACAYSVCEKTIVLSVGLKLRDYLTARGANVKMSRSTDVYVSISARASAANSWGAHRFVSIHMNSCGGCGGHGTEVLICGSSSSTVNLANKELAEITAKLGTTSRGVKQRCDLGVLSGTNMPATLAELAFIDYYSENQLMRGSTGQQKAACAILRAIEKHYGTTATAC